MRPLSESSLRVHETDQVVTDKRIAHFYSGCDVINIVIVNEIMVQVEQSSREQLLQRSPHISTAEGLYTSMSAQIASNPMEVIEMINEQEKRNYRYGVMFLVIAVSTWIFGLELVNAVMKQGDYDKPCFVSCVTGSCFSLLLLPDLFLLFKRSVPKKKKCDADESTRLLRPSYGEDRSTSLETVFKKEEQAEIIELKFSEVIILALHVALLYLCYNFMVMNALRFTSASNQTVLGTTTSMFTLIIGRFLGIDRFSMKKVFCIIVSTTGVLLVNVSENKERNNGNGSKFTPKNPLLGNCFALVGALLYALYLILMKIKCGSENRTTNERRLLGYVGIWTFLLSAPVLYCLDYFQIEEFQHIPIHHKIFRLILINGVFSIISDYATILAMLLTSPLVTSLSLTSSVPITIVIDYIKTEMNSDNPNSEKDYFIYILGIISILISVVLININISSENELIGEVIEDALEDAIKDDEVLSPVLSPLLVPPVSPNFTSPVLSGHGVTLGFSHPGIFRRLYPSMEDRGTSKHVPGLDLNDNKSNSNNKGNKNEGPSTNDLSQLETSQQPDNSTLQEGTNASNLVVYGGENHRYHVRHLDWNTS